MIGLLVASITAIAPLTTTTILPCDGIRQIEAATTDRPIAFATLREVGKKQVIVRNSAGQNIQREVPVTTVKALSGFASCRFVYSGQVDLACYVGTTLADTDADAIAAKLISTAERVGQCLTNRDVTRVESELGSTPSIGFGGGSRQPFWQISMVPTQADPSRIQPELLVLGPAPMSEPPRARVKAKSRKR